MKMRLFKLFITITFFFVCFSVFLLYSNEPGEGRKFLPGIKTTQRFDSPGSTTNNEPFWSYALFDYNVGSGNIVVTQLGSQLEIYTTSGSDDYDAGNFWESLQYNSITHQYYQTYVSTNFTHPIRRMLVANVMGDSQNEIVVATENGHIFLYNQSDKKLISDLSTAVSELTGMAIRDIDNDGVNELILCNENDLYVYSASGSLEWNLPGAGGYEVVVGQMDTDSALEIAVTSGKIIDTSSRTVQWTRTKGFGRYLGVADIDNDGKEELIVADYMYIVWSYDVDRQLPKWSIPVEYDINAIHLADIDNDSEFELFVCEGLLDEIRVYNTRTQEQECVVANLDYNVENIVDEDVDGDGNKELVLGAEQKLYVIDYNSKQIEWNNLSIGGPFNGPEIGDMDGDGEKEIVAFSSNRILVFDSTGTLLATTQGLHDNIYWTGVFHDFTLYDVDNDSKPEIITAIGDWESSIGIFDFNIDHTITLNWSISVPYGSDLYFCSVKAADIDNDGQIEIIGGCGSSYSENSGAFVYVYDYSTGNEEWRSDQHGVNYWDRIMSLEIADLDNDGTQEIIDLVSNGDVYILNGKTKAIEAIKTGPFTTMFINKAATPNLLILGDANGYIYTFTYNGVNFTEKNNVRYVSTKIDGITVHLNYTLFGSEGRLYIARNGVIDWSSNTYGNVFGKHVAFMNGIGKFYTAGLYSVMGFNSPYPALTVASPNGRESLLWGSTNTITWDSSNLSDTLSLSLWRNGSKIGDIATGISNTIKSYSWEVGSYSGGIVSPGTGYAIQISENGTAISDSSDASFTITAPVITVTSPNGFENWLTGSLHTITWTNTGTISNVKIEYTTNNGSSWTELIASTPNTGSFAWAIPNISSTSCKVRVSHPSFNTISDSSNKCFSIVSGFPAYNKFLSFSGDNLTDIIWRLYESPGSNRIWYTNGIAPDLMNASSQNFFRNTFNTFMDSRIDRNSDNPVQREIDELMNDNYTSVCEVEMNSGVDLANSIDKQMSVGLNLSETQNINILSTQTVQAVSDLNWRIEGTGDFNTDGKLDILWRHYSTGKNMVWMMNGPQLLRNEVLPSTSNLNWKMIGGGDFNADGKADILWRNYENGKNIVWLMDGLTFTKGVYLPTIADLNWEMVGLGDMDGNGTMDIVWRNKSTGADKIWIMNGTTYVSESLLPAITDPGWKIVGCGEFNGDGKTDLIWRHDSGSNTIWIMSGLSISGFQSLPAESNANWKIEN